MLTEFWWVFDALVLLLVGKIVFSNAKKGMTKVLVVCIGYLIATVIATFGSSIAADSLYELAAKPTNLSAIEEANGSIDVAQCFLDAIDERKYGVIFSKKSIQNTLDAPNTAMFEKALYSYVNQEAGFEVCSQTEFKQILTDAFVEQYGQELLDKMPRYVYANFQREMRDNPAMLNVMVEQLFKSNVSEEEKAEYIEERFGKAPSTECFRIFIYIIVFSIVMVIAGVLSGVMKYRLYFNLLSRTEHFLGGLLGLIEALALVIIMTMVVRLCILIGGGEFLFFSEDTIEKTYIYKYIYSQLDILM